MSGRTMDEDRLNKAIGFLSGLAKGQITTGGNSAQSDWAGSKSESLNLPSFDSMISGGVPEDEDDESSTDYAGGKGKGKDKVKKSWTEQLEDLIKAADPEAFGGGPGGDYSEEDEDEEPPKKKKRKPSNRKEDEDEDDAAGGGKGGEANYNDILASLGKGLDLKDWAEDEEREAGHSDVRDKDKDKDEDEDEDEDRPMDKSYAIEVSPFLASITGGFWKSLQYLYHDINNKIQLLHKHNGVMAKSLSEHLAFIGAGVAKSLNVMDSNMSAPAGGPKSLFKSHSSGNDANDFASDIASYRDDILAKGIYLAQKNLISPLAITKAEMSNEALVDLAKSIDAVVGNK